MFHVTDHVKHDHPSLIPYYLTRRLKLAHSMGIMLEIVFIFKQSTIVNSVCCQ